SSKRAAKMTGYAKDYIGQLCREGRVPARLIGRSWYVLEAAIQDHRFGTSEDVGTFGNPESEKAEAAPSFISTWESPRYEAASDELLPSLNRLKDTEPSIADQEAENEPQRIQDSWKEWFDRFDHVNDTVAEPVTLAEEVPEEPEIEKDTEEIQIPIHTVYQPPPEELLPRHREIEPPSEPVAIRRKSRRGNRRALRAIQMAGATFAVFVAAVAIIGSGYFDTYVVSVSQVRMLAGVTLYNK
ncbi:MAG: hypothetical protein Q8O94_01610, partial [bacterium]|nr:hypothetical protein [bacterium]